VTVLVKSSTLTQSQFVISRFRHNLGSEEYFTLFMNSPSSLDFSDHPKIAHPNIPKQKNVHFEQNVMYQQPKDSSIPTNDQSEWVQKVQRTNVR
jgi:hypothetical protein